MKKKILFLTEALWIGGIETALVNLLNHLDYNRFDVTCLITRDYQAMAKDIIAPCRLLVADRHHCVSFRQPYRFSKLYDLTQEPKSSSGLRRLAWRFCKLLLRAPEARLYSSYLRQMLESERFDTVVIYSDRTAEFAVRAIRADRFLMFYHNADIGRAYHDTYGYRRCERIIAVSENQCKALKQLRPHYAEKMIAIHNLIDAESILKKAEAAPEKPYLDSDNFHLVSCGRLAPQKGFDLAVKACADLVSMGYSNLKWHIFGEGAQRAELQSLIRKYGMEKHFFLHGVASNPFPYIKAADLYVQPSRTEGYSLSILEARVLACPTAATRGAAEEQMTDGVTGTLCEATEASIRDAILRHLRDPNLSTAYRQALRKHSFDAENNEILKQIESLL